MLSLSDVSKIYPKVIKSKKFFNNQPVPTYVHRPDTSRDGEVMAMLRKVKTIHGVASRLNMSLMRVEDIIARN